MVGFPFVGRGELLAELDAAAAQALAGRGALLALTGPAGVGKTRAAEEAARRAEGLRLLWVRCAPDGVGVALEPWSVVTRELAVGGAAGGRLLRGSAELRALVAGHGDGQSLDRQAARLRLSGDLVRLVRAAAEAEPLLLVLDDLHEADASSVELLLALAAGTRAARVLLLATARDDPGAWRGREDGRAALLRAARCLPVGPLGETEVAELLGAAAGSRPEAEAVRELLGRTGGEALFVTELLRHPGPGPLPETVAAAVGARTARLPAGCGHLLGAAAVLGTRFRLDVLAELAQVPLGALRAELGEAVDAGLLAMVEPGAGAFRHDLLREAVYQGLGPVRRAVWHDRAGAVLARYAERGRGVGPAQAAHHLLLAGPERTAEAAEFARRAGASAAGLLAYEDAAQWYGRAVAALDGTGPVAQVRLELAAALLGAGQRERARAESLRAAQDARRDGRPDLLARAALGLGAGPTGFEVDLLDRAQLDLLAEARAALSEATPDGPALLAAVTARLSVAGSLLESDQERRAQAEEAVRLARAAGDAATLAYALSALCDARAGPADCERRREWAEEIVRLARSLPEPSLELLGRRLRLVALMELGEAAEADREVLAYGATEHALRQPLYSWYVPLWQGMRALLEGRFADCERRLAEVAELGRRAGSGNAELLGSTQRWCLLAELEDPERIAELMAGLPPLAELPGVWPKVSQALVSAQLGERDQAVAQLLAAAPLLPGAPQDSEWLPMLAQAVETLALTEAAGEEAAALARQLREWLAPYQELYVVEGIGAAVRGPVSRYLALLAQVSGEPETARGQFAAALAAARAIGASRLAERIAREAGREQPRSPDRGVFRREGPLWRLGYAGAEVVLPDSKGLRDLAVLLARPGVPVPAVELAASKGPAAPAGEYGELHRPGDTGELLDATARTAYRRRLQELELEETEADQAGDTERSARIAVERDALVGQLSAAYGLGGRVRRTGSPAERARTAVTARVRSAIDRIAHAHPPLGRHLANAVHTGTVCEYRPEQPVAWN
ncbi:AAA family ATPase [Kitasatospora sp. NPDC002227]|uniref:ATP-binding protein n=1 Tax=Kitasatospora sp. NPDC002227 TaxID=3154773 RepID=UPI00332F287D